MLTRASSLRYGTACSVFARSARRSKTPNAALLPCVLVGKHQSRRKISVSAALDECCRQRRALAADQPRHVRWVIAGCRDISRCFGARRVDCFAGGTIVHWTVKRLQARLQAVHAYPRLHILPANPFQYAISGKVLSAKCMCARSGALHYCRVGGLGRYLVRGNWPKRSIDVGAFS